MLQLLLFGLLVLNPTVLFNLPETRSEARTWDQQPKQQIDSLDVSAQTIMPQQIAYKDFSIYLLTYNLNGQNPALDNLAGLFDFDALGQHDIYAIALEELTYGSLVLTTDPYIKGFDQLFQSRGYTRLVRSRLMLTSLALYVPRTRLTEFNDVKTCNIQVELQKGSVGVRLYYKGISMAFVGAHLAAHDEKYETRVKQYKDIIAQTSFSDAGRDGILDQDYAFFFGDLNFRLNEFTPTQINAVILQATANPANSKTNWNMLLEKDQLVHARVSRKAFAEFDEAQITFAPTFKFVLDTDNYNLKRKPGYTDRILFRNTLASSVSDPSERALAELRLSNYDSLHQFRGSDHKPVRTIARFNEAAVELKWRLRQRELESRRRAKRAFRREDRARLATFAKTADSTVPTAKTATYQEFADGTEPESTQPMQAYRYQRDRSRREDPSLRLVRFLRIEFEPVRNWTLDSNQTVWFRVLDSRTGQAVTSDMNGLFQVLSNWDWIGLYREDFSALDQYITFAFARFNNSVEEAQDALGLLALTTHSDSDSSNGSLSQSSSLNASPRSTSPASDSPVAHSPSLIQSSSLTSKTSTSSQYPSSNDFGDDHEVPLESVHHNEVLANEAVDHSSSSPPGELYSAFFDENNYLVSPGRYVLIYRRKNGDVLGISDSFRIDYRTEQGAEVGEDFDPSSSASSDASSSSAHHNRSRSASLRHRSRSSVSSNSQQQPQPNSSDNQ